MNTESLFRRLFRRRVTRARLGRKYGWDAETQRLAILHALDPVARFDADFEARIRAFVEAR